MASSDIRLTKQQIIKSKQDACRETSCTKATKLCPWCPWQAVDKAVG